MASSSNWRHASLAVALLAATACGELKKSGPPPMAATDIKWRTASVEAVKSVRVENSESAGTRAAVGFLAGGIIGMAITAGATEKNLGSSGAWEYTLRLEETAVNIRSFAVFGPGDCVRFASNIAGNDVPMERIAQETCGVK